jgi:hypothetical protein
VAAELADTVITALVAMESLGVDTDQVMAECVAKILRRVEVSPAVVE